jgi:hypothetical protein
MAHAAALLAQKFDWDRIAGQWANLFSQVAELRQKFAGTRYSEPSQFLPLKEEF